MGDFGTWDEWDAALSRLPRIDNASSIEFIESVMSESSLGGPEREPNPSTRLRDENLPDGINVISISRFCDRHSIPHEWTDGWPSAIEFETIYLSRIHRYIRRFDPTLQAQEEDIIEGATDDDPSENSEWSE